MMSLWDALRMNMMISYQELVRTFPNTKKNKFAMWFSPREVHGYSCFYESESTPGLRKILTKYFNGM
ncbi:hypothetical protein, partial [Raoultella ornithinolytica]|uniref:hypothetical protein n=1 Tax=Raoultella ornithinolytica TaxID=54291 RepID=UPI00113AC065